MMYSKIKIGRQKDDVDRLCMVFMDMHTMAEYAHDNGRTIETHFYVGDHVDYRATLVAEPNHSVWLRDDKTHEKLANWTPCLVGSCCKYHAENQGAVDAFRAVTEKAPLRALGMSKIWVDD